jgi:ABC-type transport system involved in multi-copper enzyme maturation permease subunit
MIGVIAKNTVKEVLRDRVWFVLLGFGFVLLAASRILTPLALGEGPRITVDLGLTAVSGLGLLVVAVVGASLVHQEIERRTVHVILARPISRATYLIGKWAGLTLAVWITGAITGAALIGVTMLVRGEAARSVAQAVVLVELSFLPLTALAVLFSSLSTPLLSSLYTLCVYALGFWTADMRGFAHQLEPPLSQVLTAASYALPHLDLFSARLAVAHAEPVPGMQLVLAALYALTYAAAVLSVAAVAFDGREFK